MLHTGLGTKTMYAFENGFFPSVSSPPPAVEPCSHSGLSLTAIVSSTIKCRSKKKNILQHLSWAQPQESRTYRNTQKCTTHSRRMGVTIDFCADVRDIAQILRPGYKRCFVFRELWLFCDTRPMTELCLDFRSVKLWTASIFSPISATFTFL